jgi:hypothetical protein
MLQDRGKEGCVERPKLQGPEVGRRIMKRRLPSERFAAISIFTERDGRKGPPAENEAPAKGNAKQYICSNASFVECQGSVQRDSRRSKRVSSKDLHALRSSSCACMNSTFLLDLAVL